MNKDRLWAALYVLAGAVAALLIVILGFGGFHGFARAAKFASVQRIIASRYVGEYDADAVTDAALSSAIVSLGDEWSYYMDADSYDAYQDYSANVYQGIGVTVSMDEATGGFLVHATDRDGPADRAGVLAGDIILAVDGVDMKGKTTEQLRSSIQADYGREALLTLQGADGETREVSVLCEEIYSNPVTYQLLDGHVGYIAISNFRQGAGQESIAAVDSLRELGADCLVFEMVEILDYLLPEGDLFIRADKKGHEVVETSDDDCVEMPMAVVVNAESYSAAEFFAAALRDYDWAKIAGEPTTGKARSQVTYSLWDGSAVHLSTYSYLTPSRTDLYEAGGLVPDAEAAMPEELQLQYQTGWLEPEDDPQVQAAIALLDA